MIAEYTRKDLSNILNVINEAALKYKEVIPDDGGRHVLLGNTTHRIGYVSSLFRSAHAPEQGVHQVHVSRKRVVEF